MGGYPHLREIFSKGLRRDRHGGVHTLRIDTLLIARGSLRAHVETLRCTAYAERVEAGDLEDEFRRIVKDRVELASHDSGEPDGRLLVGDDEILGREVERLAVKQLQLLALVGAAHVNAARDMFFVKSVGRLPRGEHHVVRDVYGQIDRTHPDAPDQAFELKGRGNAADILNDEPDITGAPLRVLYLHLQLLGHPGETGCFDRLQRAFVDSGEFARHSIVSPEVRAVRHRLVIYLMDYIVKPESFGQRSAGLRVKFADVHYLGLPRRRKQLREAYLAGGADHAETHHAAQLRGLYLNGLSLSVPPYPRPRFRHDYQLRGSEVHAAADDRRRRRISHVHRADAKLVGVGMRFDRQYPPDHEPSEIVREADRVLDLDRRHRKVIRKSGHRKVGRKVGVFLYPV